MTAAGERFDRRYADLRAAGAGGWLTPADEAEVFGHVRRLLAAAGAAGGRLLELGCGAGNLSRRLAALGFEVVGVDLSPTAVRWAAERGAGPRYVVGSATDLAAVGGGPFDLVLDGLCLHGLVGADRAACLAAVAGRLRPGGAFLVLTMCNDPVPAGLRERFDPRTRTVPAGGPAEVCLLPADTVAAELTAAGFRLVWSEVVAGDAARAAQDLFLAVGKTPGGRRMSREGSPAGRVPGGSEPRP